MADQLNLLGEGQVIPTALHTEMQQSYLEYAMSVIVGRALPDVRDGMKPVHRRIVYAMHELGLTPDRPYRKCARVVGDVLGKYHPHGDQAVYDALVRMVQEFSSRYPVLAGHGNFGSVDNDPPAAMRYTETRLATIGHEALLGDISEAIVEFIGNFDNSQQEPVVLPAQLPFLLLNGSSGIAVGMATNIPPHNAGEVIDGLIALIDRPDLSDDKLFELIPGPDFPTGGEIIDRSGVQEAYRTGRGSIPVRGVSSFEEIQLGRGRHRRPAIVVTELPFQVNKAGWIEKMADLVNQGRLEGISDIRDESDRDGMRVVIELKREANPQLVLNQLYKLTPLQSNFGVILLALVDGQPRQLSLREMLQHFLNFREETLVRQYGHELEEAESRAHLVEGLLAALDNLDRVIEILRQAADGTTARHQLQAELGLSDRQSDAILAMPLRRLTGLEQQNLRREAETLGQKIQELQGLLGDRRELLKALKKELRALKRKFGDPRRTRIPHPEELAAEAEMLAEIVEEAIAEEEMVLEFTHRGYVQRRSPKAFQRQQRSETEAGTIQELDSTDDFTIQTVQARSNQELLVLTRSGKAYTLEVGEIPPTPRRSKGTPVIALHEALQGDPDAIVSQIVLPDELSDRYLIMLTAQGRIKRLPLSEFSRLTSRGLTALKLKDGDELAYAIVAQTGLQMVLATSGGRMLRFDIDDEQLPIMGRTAQGHPGVRLRRQERIVGCVAAPSNSDVVLVTDKGYGKRLPIEALRLGNRGDIGMPALQFEIKADALASIISASAGPVLTVLTDGDRLLRLPIDTLPVGSKTGPGDRVIQTKRDERIVWMGAIAPIP